MDRTHLYLNPESDYENELQKLKEHDEVQDTTVCKFSGFNFIYTAGHGYLVIPIIRNNTFTRLARKIVDYGYVGKLAIYLEEDCEAPEFINYLKGVSV